LMLSPSFFLCLPPRLPYRVHGCSFSLCGFTPLSVVYCVQRPLALHGRFG
jgi:hypothetical protein